MASVNQQQPSRKRMHLARCRICGNDRLLKFLTLGPTPLANRFLNKDQLKAPEPVYPLDVYFCSVCGLMQLVDIVPAEVLFRDYIYFSSTSETIPRHFSMLAQEVIQRFTSSNNPLIVEIASNDGVLLKAFKGCDVRTLGVEPATNIAKVAQAAGVETINEFFNSRTALKIRKDRGSARVIIANNVLAHINGLLDFVKGIATLLDDDGVVIIEVPYLVDLIEKNEYDTIYHEHHSYFSIRTLVELFSRFDMEIFDAKRLDVHGGSIRIYVRKERSPSTRAVSRLLRLEKSLSLDSPTTYLNFATRVESVREALQNILKRLKSEGKRIVGYGAAAKGNTLLNYCKIDTEIMDYIVDRSPYKQGLYTPGMHIPVRPVESLLSDNPDYVLLLAWNFADEILMQQREYRRMGGRFVIPIPSPKIV